MSSTCREQCLTEEIGLTEKEARTACSEQSWTEEMPNPELKTCQVPVKSRAHSAHARQSRQDYVRGFRAKVLKTLLYGVPSSAEKEFFIDNLLVRIHYTIVTIRWTGLAQWESEFSVPGSLTSTFGR